MTDSTGYQFHERAPTADEFLALRAAAEMGPRGHEAAARGLEGSLYAITVTRDGETVGMGRVIGDGGCVYQIGDMVVDPAHQGAGVGSEIMDRLMTFIERDAPPGAYVNLIADVDDFYERWGFEPVEPASKGMHLRTDD